MNPNTLDILIQLIENNLFVEISKSINPIEIPNKIKVESKDIIWWEEISDLNGLVIPAILESKLNNSLSSIENYVQEQLIDKNLYDSITNYVGKINIPCKTLCDYLKVGNIYLSIQSKLHARLAQIKKYNWLNNKLITQSHKKLNMIKIDTLFEITITSDFLCDYVDYNHNIYGCIQIKGRLDAINDDTVWEFKCVDNLTIEHKLQLIVYYWMWKQAKFNLKYGKKEFSLINIKSGQILKLNLKYELCDYIIEQIMQILFDEKFSKKTILNEYEFINMCKNNKIYKN